MKRIGIAASKISQGNIFLYNLFVVILSSLFSLLVFFLSGFSIFLAMYFINALSAGFISSGFEAGWGSIFKSCMMALAVVVFIFNLCAIGVNAKFK